MSTDELAKKTDLVQIARDIETAAEALQSATDDFEAAVSHRDYVLELRNAELSAADDSRYEAEAHLDRCTEQFYDSLEAVVEAVVGAGDTDFVDTVRKYVRYR